MLMYAGQIWKRILLNYICLLYAIIYPYFYEKLHKVSLRTFDMKWQYYSLVLLFILAFCMVILAKQELSFVRDGDSLQLTVPGLTYWTMLVFE